MKRDFYTLDGIYMKINNVDMIFNKRDKLLQNAEGFIYS